MSGPGTDSERRRAHTHQRPIRILAVDTSWFSTSGGINTFNRGLCTALAAAGAEVCCMLPGASWAEQDAANAAGVTLVSALHIPGGGADQALVRRPELPPGFVPDLIIGHGRKTGGAAQAQAGLFPGAVHVYVMHTAPDEIEWSQSGSESPSLVAERKTKEETDLAVAATRSLAVGPLLHGLLENFLRVHSVPPPMQINPGFDAGRIDRTPPGRVREVLLAGRLEDVGVKGVDIAARAFRYVQNVLGSDAGHNVRLVLRGVPPDRDREIYNQVRELADWSSMQVILRPYAMDGKDLEDDIRRAALVIMPSRAEAYGLVGVEAIAAGTPVLISDKSGLAKHLTNVAERFADRVIVAVGGGKGDEAADARRWGEEIAKVLRHGEGRSADAVELATHMRAKATWAASAQTILNLHPDRFTAPAQSPCQPAGRPSTSQRGSTAPPTAGRKRLSVLVWGLAPIDDVLLDRLWADVGDSARHVTLWNDTRESGRESPDHVLRRADAVLVLLAPGSREDVSSAITRRRLDALDAHAIPVIAARTGPAAVPPSGADWPVVDLTKAAGWRELWRRLDELGMPEPDISAREFADAAEEVAESTDRQPLLINEMPQSGSASFLDRDFFSGALGNLVKDPDVRVVALKGRDGIGKTALLRRLREDADGACRGLWLDAVIYLSGRGHRWVTTSTLLTDLARAAGDGANADAAAMDEHLPWRSRVDAVIAVTRDRTVVVMIDDADELVDQRGACSDRELHELIHTLAEHPAGHDITMVLCFRDHPEAFLADLAGRATTLRLDLGLDSDWAIKMLRALDTGDLGLADGPQATLHRLYDLTQGHPRSMELVAGLLKMSFMSADELADRIAGAPDVPEALLRLLIDQLRKYDLLRFMQALAVYGRPVPPDAVDHLLSDLVQRQDSRRQALNKLTAWNLVRRRGEHYYLPPVPDAQFIMTTLFDAGEPVGGLDKPTLWQRAAQYFHAARIHPAQSTADLWPQFGEIELHLRTGRATGSVDSYRTAYDLMSEVDEEYLTGWGQSQILVPWRTDDLRGKLDDPVLEIRNLSYLVAARQQQDGHREDIDELRAARWRAEAADDQLGHLFLGRQLANALFEAGYVMEAAEHNRVAIRDFDQLGQRKHEATARMELALCLIKTGSFGDAQDEFARAGRLVGQLKADTTRDTRIRLLQNVGWLAGQLGRDEEAVARLDQALDLAGPGESRVHGELHNAKAAVLLHAGDQLGALLEVETAIDLSGDHDHTLSRDAYSTMALALLVSGRVEDAMRAADRAASYSTTPQALGALGFQGLVAYRIGDYAKARKAFHAARGKANERFAHDQRDYQLLNMRGLVLCGLALLGAGQPQDAVDAYESARAITAASGVLRRNRLQLSQFGPRANDAVLAPIRAVAWPTVDGLWP